MKKAVTAINAVGGEQILSVINAVTVNEKIDSKKANNATNVVKAAIGKVTTGNAAAFKENGGVLIPMTKIATAIALRAMAKGGIFAVKMIK